MVILTSFIPNRQFLSYGENVGKSFVSEVTLKEKCRRGLAIYATGPIYALNSFLNWPCATFHSCRQIHCIYCANLLLRSAREDQLLGQYLPILLRGIKSVSTPDTWGALMGKLQGCWAFFLNNPIYVYFVKTCFVSCFVRAGVWIKFDDTAFSLLQTFASHLHTNNQK